MSLWQTFVDRHLMGEVDQNVKLTAGAIIGQDYVVWAQSPDFPKVDHDEITAIIDEFDNPVSTGFSFGGKMYTTIEGDNNSVIRGMLDLGRITIKKTGKALIVGIYYEPWNDDICDKIVERLGVYLDEMGF